MDVVLRPASAADLPAIEAIFRANEDPGSFPPGAIVPYLAHLVARGDVIVAGNDDGGRLVGFAATVDTGRSTHLADLFVLPEHQGRGHGGRLLTRALGSAWPRTTFSSSDPRALPLYIRAGMTPLWPCLYVSGDPRHLPAIPGIAVEDAALDTVARHEEAWTGVDRVADIAHWVAMPGRRAFTVTAGDRAVGVGIARLRPDGSGHWIDHAQVAPDTDPGPVLLAALRDGAREVASSGACVPGPSPALPVLLTSGFRIVDQDIYLSSDPELVDPIRELVNPGIL